MYPTIPFHAPLVGPARQRLFRWGRFHEHLWWFALAIGLSCISLMAQAQISISHLSTYSTGSFDTGAAEIVDFDPVSDRIYFVNAGLNEVRALDASNPAALTLAFTLSMAAYGAGVNSVVVVPGGIAVAVEADPKTDPGKVVFFDPNGVFLSQVTVGALPDMVTVTPNGQKVLVANEGEPDDDYLIDPQGSVSIIDISGGIASVTAANVTTIEFTGYTPAMLPGVRIFGPGATVAQDMEPEYIAVSDDSQKAFVACQENNAVVRIDLTTNTIEQIAALGSKDNSLPGNGFDASNSDGGINISTWPVRSFYMPDAIHAFTIAGQTYVAYANEGDVREYDGYEEVKRVSSGSVVLDPTIFPNAATLKQNANLGRLNITIAQGDADNDNDLDTIFTFGTRSFSIRDVNGALVYDSGDDFEQITATQLPSEFNSNNDENGTFDARSDDKGPEPEAVTVGVVNGVPYAFIGLERIGGIMVYDVSDPAAPVFVQYLNNRDFAGDAELGTAGDLGPECIVFVSAADSPNGTPLLVVGNEVSGTVSIFQVAPTAFELQILHASDFEGAVPATEDAPRFAAIVDSLEHTYANSVTLSSGDNFLPGPFMSAGEDPTLVAPLKAAYENYYGGPFANNDLRAGIGRVDITIMNILGIQAAALGNHEFDLGTSELRNIIAGQNSGTNIRWSGAQFPYLSSNLDFSADANLSNLFTNTREEHTFFQSNPAQTASAIAATKKLAPSTIITVNGERIGVVGATTQILASISSPGATTIIGPDADDMPALAAILQPVVDSLRMAEGIDKIILLSHLQQLTLEKALAPLLNGVDVIIAGGSHTLMADATDRLRAGDVAAETYPFLTAGLDGKPIAIVNTTSEYKYVGRLVVDFDANGDIVPASIDPAISGAYPADSLGVVEVWGDYADAFTPGSKGQEVQNLCGAIAAVIVAKDGNLFGRIDVFLEGRRTFVRTEETNMGNLSADANKWMARRYDPAVTISIKNGGGIRSAIGYVNAVGGNVNLEPPQANPLAGKQQGDISQLDIENSLRFNNQLSTLTLTAADLRTILEHGVAASGPGQTQGRFPQVSGVRFSYDETLPANARILNAVVTDSAGITVDTLVMNGLVHGDPARTFRVVTLNFLAGGGDGYPFNTLGTGRVDLNTLPDAGPGVASFTNAGSEQDAFAEYMKSFHSTSAYALAETPDSLDTRIEEVNDREDDILGGPVACLLNEVELTMTTDASADQLSWNIVIGNTQTVVCSGSGLPASTTFTATCCLADGCYDLQVLDSFGDGIAGGGFVLRDANGERIIDNSNNGGSFTSLSKAPLGFCLPLGSDRLTAASCDLLAIAPTGAISAEVNPAVSAQYNVTNTTSGYQFWIRNPHGGYNRRVFLAHNTGNGPAGATRCATLKLSALTTLPVPANVLLNVQVRSRVAGVYAEFGPACQLKVAVPACSTTKLVDTPGSSIFSCGVVKPFGTNAQISAFPVTGATTYQFRFERVGGGFARQIASTTNNLTLKWNTLPLVNGDTYNVTVRVSVDGGATYCPFGDVCTVTIDNTPGQVQRSVDADVVAENVTLYPNPVRNGLGNVRFEGMDAFDGTIVLEVMDLTGRRVLAEQASFTPSMRVDLSGQPDGVYLMTLTVGEQQWTRRLVVQR
ncbi:MAG TPA: choice-of-anchor I family protein [Flavobacteriales bacterium]|nr:choice-of-anchor I family protein [Flavobacteriales bacterium]HMR26232.1 choice-of-anchor I family protein [Flavobacteriales bacterium]